MIKWAKRIKLLQNDYILNVINKIYTIAIGLFSSILITRYLGLELKGFYTYIMQIVNIAVLILNLGIYQSYSYYYRKNGGNIISKYINIFAFQFLLYIFIAVIISVFVGSYTYILICLIIPFNIAKTQMENIILVENIRLKIKVHVFIISFQFLCYIVLFFFVPQNILFPILLLILNDIITMVLYLGNIKILPQPQKTDFAFMKEVLVLGFVPMVTVLLVTLNYSVDIIFLKHMGNSIELGLYATAAGIVNYIWIIPDIFKEVLFSRIARKDDINLVALSTKLSLTIIIITIFSFILCGKYAITLLYGNEFLEAYFVTIILFFGAISMVFFKILGVVFLTEGKRWFYFLTLAISVVSNMILNYILIPFYGMYGAAIASVVSYSICGVSFLIYFSKNKNIKIKELILLKFREANSLMKLITKKVAIND